MKHCMICGRTLDDGMEFCPKCGTQVSEISTMHKKKEVKKGSNLNSGKVSDSSYDLNLNNTTNPDKKKRMWVKVLLWIFLLPIMLILLIARNNKLKKKTKVILIIAIVLFTFAVAFTNQNFQLSSPSSASNGGSTNNDNNQEEKMFSDVFSDDALRSDFLIACEQIGMDIDKIKNLKQVDDWAGGTRYSFTYSGMAFRIYCNMDSTVNTIKLGMDTDIYKQGFEPYQVSDYIISTPVADRLRVLTEERVKSQLNYPSSSDFKWIDWAYFRDHNQYIVSSSVTAQNAFGVEDELAFTCIYQVESEAVTLIYFMMDGKAFVDNRASVVTPERKEISSDQETNIAKEGEIILEYGKLGEYGEAITLDGEEYIEYHVPQGTYTITNMVKFCKVYLAKDEYYKNSDGYMENEIVETLEFNKYKEAKNITIGDGEHLELTITANVTLVKK